MNTVLTDPEALNRIAYNLRRLRGDRSFREIAKIAGTFPASIKRIEDEDHMPGAGLLCRIAEALGVSVDTFYLEIPKEKVSKKKLSKAS